MYTVPIVAADLRHEETILQAANALVCLQNTTENLFNTLDKRISKNNEKLVNLKQRIEKAQIKIKQLVGTKKAIKLYAPARFPATSVFHDIPLTFTVDTVNMEMKENSENYIVQSSAETIASPHACNEKLVFFHVRSQDQTVSGETSIAAAKVKAAQTHCKGAIPAKLRSVTSLLCFDTNQSVYTLEDYSSDKHGWKRAKFQRPVKPKLNEKHILEPAPHSLAHRNFRQAPSGALRYTPKLNEAPEIDLPLDLPDLPGIANDVNFESQEQQQIAPSLYIENLPDLSDLMAEDEKATDHTPSLQTAQTINSSSSDKINEASTVVLTKLQALTAQPKTAQTPPPPPPPPPPTELAVPPPPPLPPISAAPPSTLNQNKIQNTASTTDARCDLMEAIRKAGGSQGGRLRAAAAAPISDESSSTNSNKTNMGSKNSNAGSGDLMADLHNKLLMRRKGISGANDNNAISHNKRPISSGNIVIDSLSSVIPPPPTAAALKTTIPNTDDDEWTD